MKLRWPRIRWPGEQQLTELARETCLLAGFIMLARGLWLIWPPLAWIVCGLILLWIGLPPASKGGR